MGRILSGDLQVRHSRVRLNRFWAAQPQRHVVLRVSQRARDQRAAGYSSQWRPDVGERAGHTGNRVAGAAGVLVERLLAARHVGRTRRLGIDVAAARVNVILTLGHLCIGLGCELWQALHKSHHIPYFTFRKPKLPRWHAGKADAVAGNPIQLTQMEVLGCIDQGTGQRLHALADITLPDTRGAMTLRALVMETGGTSANHGLILQRRWHDVARMQAYRPMHGKLKHREDGLKVLARRANVVETCPNEAGSADYTKDGEDCNRDEDGEGFGHRVQPIVDAYRLCARCVLALFVPILMAGLLSACSGKPTQLHAQQDPQLAARGKLLLAQYQCGSCHTIPGVAASRGVNGPTLQAFSRRSYIAGNVPNQPAALALWLVNPKALIPATTMPAMGVSPTDARAMAAYLHTLQ